MKKKTPTNSTGALAPGEEIYAPLAERGIECKAFTVRVKGRPVTAMIGSPPRQQLAADPVLLLTIGGPETHFIPPNQQPAEYFWACGHRVLSFSDSAASHIDRTRDAVLTGPNPFLAFNDQAHAVLQYCYDHKWARPGRVVVTGISRFAYFAFRLMAEDPQLNAGGGFAPVTDWRDLAEFAPCKDQKQIADLRLSRFANKLAGKKIYLAIGSHDERVSTLSCCQFFLDLNVANQKLGLDHSYVDFFITPDPGHTCGNEWFERGMGSLLDWVVNRDKEQ